MAAKYGFSDIREALVEDLRSAYPTKWEEFEAARVIGEDLFGSPKPHPNAVLGLFLEQNIKFALPFAAYQACLGGFPAVVSDRPGTVLPLSVLSSIIHGMGTLERMVVLTVRNIVYTRDLGVCPERACALNVGINHAGQRVEALNKIFDLALGASRVLSPLSLGTTLVCANCARRLEKIHRCFREQYLWKELPGLLGWRNWEGV